MINEIAAGSIWMEGGTHLPKTFSLPGGSDVNGWTALNGERAAFEKEIGVAGWTFFFMAGEIRATIFGFDKQKNLRSALKRLIANAKSQHCNCIEITQVAVKSFLSVPYVSVSAHSRHLQKGLVFAAG
jgi:hypothetical protein